MISEHDFPAEFAADFEDEISHGATPAEAARIIRLRCNMTTRADAAAWLAENAAAERPCPDLEAAMKAVLDDPHAIAARWVRRLGGGFHPDTRGEDYRPAMDSAEVAEYEDDMDALFAVAADPYECALMAMADAGLCR